MSKVKGCLVQYIHSKVNSFIKTHRGLSSFSLVVFGVCQGKMCPVLFVVVILCGFKAMPFAIC